MIEELNININDGLPPDAAQPLPFPFNQRTFCRYEPIEKRIQNARVLVVNDLLREEGDLSEIALKEWGRSAGTHLARERQISVMALENIVRNVSRLVIEPDSRVVHLSEVTAAALEFEPDAIVMSGTLRDFDYYNPAHLDDFTTFIRSTKIPVLGICGAHQLIAQSFGARIVTLDNLEPYARRDGRTVEYQYRFIRIVDRQDPIFDGIQDQASGVWQDYTKEAGILRVWQNHGLQIDRIPEGFKLLATAYLCRNQMMVKRSEGQLIYTVQFHLEKSFEDWNKNRTRWEHQNESRDGRIIFENFLREALEHTGKLAG
jgi:GMP synthase-like glutamine amidotransferase